MGILFKSSFSGLIYFIWFLFFTKSENNIDALLKDRKLLDEKIKNISDTLASIRESFSSIKFKGESTISPIAEKIYFIPLGKVQLRKFIIDMTVDMNYLKNGMNNETNSTGSLKATADVNAKLVEEDDGLEMLSRPVNKKKKSGHFEYFSPQFKVNLKALPVGMQLFIPIHKITSIYQFHNETMQKLKNKTMGI